MKNIETETLKQQYRIHAYRALASPSLIALSSKVFSHAIEPLKTSLGILESLSAMIVKVQILFYNLLGSDPDSL